MSIVQAPAFYFPTSFCYDTVCSSVDVPWVSSFQALGLNTVCVLTQTTGVQQAGLYVRADSQSIWRMALSYEDMCNFLAGAVSVRIIVNAATVWTPPPGSIVFRSGYQMPTGSGVTPGVNAIWVVASPIINESQNVVTLLDLQGNVIGNFVVQ